MPEFSIADYMANEAYESAEFHEKDEYFYQYKYSHGTCYFIVVAGIKGSAASVYCILNLRGPVQEMKRLVSAFLPILFVFSAMGQNGNEWIQYHQPYFKIPVALDGLYRISFEALREAGLPVSADPRSFRLFHRGAEQAILVGGESDGVFNTGDYMEFYGQKNDGTLDSTLYEATSYQPHRFYNLYSDTSSYFLTYGSVNGKRITTYSGSSAGLTEESFHWAEKLLVLKESYSGGVDYGSVQKTIFDKGEGWMGAQILQGQEITYTLEGITDISTASARPQIEILLTGRGPMVHNVEVYAGARMLSAATFAAFESHQVSELLEWSDIDGTGKLSIRVRVTGTGGVDRVSAGYIRVWFPQQISMGAVSERMFFLHADGRFVKIQDPPSGVRLFDVTDPSGLVHIEGQLSSSLDAVVAESDMPRKILATTRTLSAAPIKRVVFREIDPALHNYVIITHPLLRKPALGYVDPVKAFAEYRSFPEGGGFDTLVVNIDQLYDQFNYGEASPRAIFQFMKFLASKKLPEYLFLVGKGLDINYGYRRNPAAFSLYKDLVPTAGYPASDMAFTAGLGGTAHVHGVATGRLTANFAADVAAYLNKVKARDALPFDDLNRKKILHLSGGIEETEPALFRGILRTYAQVAEDLYLGGQVQAIAKQSTDIKLINIAEQVNLGLGLITFFGHSAPNTLDFDIGHVSDPVMGYNNPGKYPFLLMNGCDAGSFFLNTAILGENWITTADKGAVGFIAHSSYGLVSSLARYSSTFYNVAFGDSVFIKRGVGMVQQEVSKRYLAESGASAAAVSQVQQMVLLGDPAVRIFGAEKPDYALDPERISVSSFNDEPITALTDSFRLNIPIRNFGISQKKNIRINIKREFNGGQVLEYDEIIPSVLFADTISVVIRNTDSNGYGINVFTVHIEADNFVEELNETNNIAGFEYFIPLNGTTNLFPYNYSIVHDHELSLSFQYTDPLSTTRDFILEVDTVNSFNSAYKQQFRISAQVLGRQAVTLSGQDTLAYYWRTRIADPLENESKEWAVSSFTYMKNGPEGWAQLHFQQFESDESVGLVKDPVLRKIRFKETVSDIAIKTFSKASGKPRDSVSFRINGVEFNLIHEGGACRNNTINLVAFDRRSTQPYAGIYFKWYEAGGGRLLCGREPYVINSFTPQELNTGNHDDLSQYVDNIRTGDSVVLFNIGDAGFSLWPEAARVKLGELGISAAQLDDFQDGDPVVIFGRKGSAPGTARIYHGPSPETSLVINKVIAGRFSSGTLSSGLIGPAQRWDRFMPRVKEVEAAIDEFSFAVVGIKTDGKADTLRTEIHSEEDLSFIDPAEYPQIKIVFETRDDINLTAVQIPQWLVLYEPVAEGLVVYRGPTSPQVAHEGETVLRDFGFINISNKTFLDSLTVHFELVNQANPGTPSEIKIGSPGPGDTTLFKVPFQTLSRGGLNDVEVFVNPRLQPEVTFDNNLIVLPRHLDVLTDKRHPVMEVTVDGRYLRHGDYVSPTPSIVIRMWDENRFLLKRDTLGVRIFLAKPCATEPCAFERIYFSRDDVSWDAATDTSDFKVYFSPRDLVNGQHVLRVEAQDASENTSGDVPYEMGFNVEHEESIVVTPAYPNPFFLETGWDVTITGGQEVSCFYRLFITTLSGSVVGEFSNDAAGLHVGINRIRWEGHGNDGQSLPNGIYFYHLILREGGNEHEYNGKVVLNR